MWNNENLVKILKEGGVAVMPTDTIYGIVGSALKIPTVNRIYNLRKRNPDKPCILLIGDLSQLEKFSIVLSPEQSEKIMEYWLRQGEVAERRPTSIILDCFEEKLSYLHRGTKTLAFRLPAQEELRDLLLKTGPLIAPSANTEGSMPSKNIYEAKNYFGDGIDIYIDGGEITGNPSKVIKLHKNGTVNILRA